MKVERNFLLTWLIPILSGKCYVILAIISFDIFKINKFPPFEDGKKNKLPALNIIYYTWYVF